MIKNKKLLNKIFKYNILLGHKSTYRHPKMSKYILLKQNNIDIINPIKFIKNIKKSKQILKKCINIGGSILFVGTKNIIKDVIKKYAQKINMPYINYKWHAGLLTNIQITKLSINKKSYIDKKIKKNYKYLSKKEIKYIDRKYDKIDKFFGSIYNMHKLPLLVIIVDVKKENIAVKEAKKKGLYIIGIVDSDSSPENVNLPIPANDDSSKSIKLIFKILFYSIIKKIKKNNKYKK
ncbi:30S ribosomal protein S2 [Candidatus Shikimatogenerans bostrichidophilus]|uniref:30S ribosomal protein S2 n=1 Tax=Candidatus Shikimatogenerans bostrichidophilus TaxID=2943807 RepID=UPI002965DD9E